MPTDPSTLAGAFQYAGFWFLADKSLTQVPTAVASEPLDFIELAGLEKRIPELASAPLASWLLARVASMTRGRAHYAYDQVVGCDGDDFDLAFTCLSPDGAVVGCALFVARKDAIALTADAVPPQLTRCF